MVAILPFACESLIETSFPTNESLAINTFFLIGNINSEISSLIIAEEGLFTLIFIFILTYFKGWKNLELDF